MSVFREVVFTVLIVAVWLSCFVGVEVFHKLTLQKAVETGFKDGDVRAGSRFIAIMLHMILAALALLFFSMIWGW